MPRRFARAAFPKGNAALTFCGSGWQGDFGRGHAGSVWVLRTKIAPARRMEPTKPQPAEGLPEGFHDEVTLPPPVHLASDASAGVTTGPAGSVPQLRSSEGERGAATGGRQKDPQKGVGGAPYSGRYSMVKALAKGGMGEIHLATDSVLRREVALKVSTVSHGEEDPRFRKEAEVLANLAHPNIVPIYALGVDEAGRPFYAMKLVKGRTLQSIIDSIRKGEERVVREYPQARLLSIFRKVCDAMAFAHAQGVLHRDLKPENIMVGEYGEVLVMDWGLAKVIGVEDENRASLSARTVSGSLSDNPAMTIEGEVMGTPQYMSPEQANGVVSQLDEGSDIYSLGGILYACLTYKAPVDGKTLDEVLGHVRSGTLSPMATASRVSAGIGGRLESISVEVPEALRAVVLKAMAKERKGRYETVLELAAEVEAYQSGFATRAESASGGRQLKLWILRNRTLSAAILVFILMASAFAAQLVVSERVARGHAKVAAEEARKAIEEKAAALKARAKAYLALAEAENKSRNPQVMLRFLENIPAIHRDQEWNYLNDKLKPPNARFPSPKAPIVQAFPVHDGDGTFLTIDQDGDVRYVDAKKGFGEVLTRLVGPMKELTFAFSGAVESQRLAVISNRSGELEGKRCSAILDVLEIPSARPVFRVGLSQVCRTLDFSPLGNLIRLERLPKEGVAIQVFDAYTGSLLWQGGPKEAITTQFKPDETWLLCLRNSGLLEELNPWTGESSDKSKTNVGVSGLVDRIKIAGWVPTAKQVCSRYMYADRQTLRVSYVGDGATAFEFPIGHGSFPHHSPSGRQIVVSHRPSAEGRVLERLDLGSGIAKQRLFLLGDYNQFWAHSDDSYVLCASQKEVTFLRWEMAGKFRSKVNHLRGGPVWLFAKGERAAGANENKLSVVGLNPVTGEAGARFDIPVRGKSVAFSRDRSLVTYVTLANPPEVVVAKVVEKGVQELKRWKTNSGSVPILSPSGRLGWTAQALHDMEAGKMVREYPQIPAEAVLSTQWLGEVSVIELVSRKQDGEVMSDKSLRVRSVETGEVLFEVPASDAQSVSVSPDGRWVAEAGVDGRVRLRQPTTLEIDREFRVHDARLFQLVWHPKLPVFVTSAEDWQVRVWDAGDGRLIQACTSWDQPVYLDMSADGLWLAVKDYYTSLQVIPIQLENR